MSNLSYIPGKIKSVVLDSLVGAGPNIRPIQGLASTPKKDRGGDIVRPKAFESTMPKFMQNPIMLYMHNMMTPIGTWDDYRISDEGLWLKGQIVEGIAQADYVWTLVQKRVLRALSIGFIETKANFDKEEDAYVIDELELFETSVVSIPMNDTALISLDANGKFVSIQPATKFIDPSPQESWEGRKIHIFVPASNPVTAEDTDMTPEQEQKLNEAHTALSAITKDITEIRETQATLATTMEVLKTLPSDIAAKHAVVEQLASQVNDLQTCLIDVVKLLPEAEEVLAEVTQDADAA